MTVYAFYKAPGGTKDKLTRLVTGGPYSHVETLRQLPDRQDVMQSIAASFRDGRRVRCKEIDFKPGHWDFVVTQSDEKLTWTRAKQVVMRGARYDLAGALLSVTPFWRRDLGQDYFCSGLAAWLEKIPEPGRYCPNLLFATLAEDDRNRVLEG